MTNRDWGMMVGVFAAMLAAAQLAGPSALGLPPQAAGWMGVLSAGLTAWALYLPSVKHRLPASRDRIDDQPEPHG